MKKIDNYVDTKITHPRPHQDEEVAVTYLDEFGEPVHPGIAAAKFIVHTKVWDKYPSNMVPIGIGEEDYDEHRNGDRLPGKCAAILVVDKLRKHGIKLPKRTDPFMEEVLWCDEGADAFSSMTATLNKGRYRVDEKRWLGTYYWMADATKAIWYGEPDLKFNLWDSWCAYTRNLPVKDDLLRQSFYHVSNLVSDSMTRQGKYLTEISSVGSLLPLNIRDKWLGSTFEFMLRDAEMYQMAHKEVVENSWVDEFVCDGYDKPLRVAFFEGDNEHAKSVAFSKKGLGAALFVQSSPTKGNVQIFSNPQLDVDLAHLALAIRLMEYKVRHSQKLKLSHAQGLGKALLVPQWFLHKGRNLLLNGSLTHPGIQATVLTLGHIWGLIKVVFQAPLREAWIANYYGEEKLELLPVLPSLREARAGTMARPVAKPLVKPVPRPRIPIAGYKDLADLRKVFARN